MYIKSGEIYILGNTGKYGSEADLYTKAPGHLAPKIGSVEFRFNLLLNGDSTRWVCVGVPMSRDTSNGKAYLLMDSGPIYERTVNAAELNTEFGITEIFTGGKWGNPLLPSWSPR